MGAAKLASVGAVLLSLAGIASCARSCAPGSPNSAGGPESGQRNGSAGAPRKTGGHTALDFDYEATTSLLFTAEDPTTGTRWTTRLVRAAPGDWRIASAPEGIPLGDVRAHGNWVLHMLDTVRTAQFTEVPFSGNPESFGLANPRVRLRWTVAAALQKTEETYELDIGAPAKSETGESAYYVSIPGVPKTYVLQGALLKVLELVSSFDSLRLPTLATFAADDVDDFSIQAPGRKVFTAQREGDDWKVGKRASPAVGAFIEQFTHLRVDHFVDAYAERTRLASALAGNPIYILRFKGRRGFNETVQLGSDRGHVYATLSSRHPEGSSALSVFEVRPEILGSIAVQLHSEAP